MSKAQDPNSPHFERPAGFTDYDHKAFEVCNDKAAFVKSWKGLHEPKARVATPAIAKAQEPPTKAKAPKVGYIAHELVALNLPHKKPKGDVWVRQNGNLTLLVQGGHYIDPITGNVVKTSIPYGATARLVLFYVMSAAAFSDSPIIYLGNSFDAFLKAIGATPESRGVKTGAGAVLNQIYNIIYASFSIQKIANSDDFTVDQGKPNRRLVETYEIWFSRKNTNKAQQGLWGSYIELSKELFQSLKKHPVPIDWDIVLKLRNDPTALDLYGLLTYESAKAQATGKGRFIPWASLHEQTGSDIQEIKTYSSRARSKIRTIEKIYKGLKVNFPKGGLFIEAGSLPSVPLSPPKKLVIKG